MTAIQELWAWIDANYHEDNFNLNNAKEMSLRLEREQRIKDYKAGYIDASINHIEDAENYVNELEYINQK